MSSLKFDFGEVSGPQCMPTCTYNGDNALGKKKKNPQG